jgi:Flp pilus assembly pilin Flp
VLQRFKTLLKRFQRDERGAFLVLFGVLAIVLIATSGAVVDYTQIEQARTRAQNALDAAALGLQPHVFDKSPVWTKQNFIDQANLLLSERTADMNITSTVTDATINVANGQLILSARITVPTSFVALVGIEDVNATLVSEATRKRLNIEVAMVLDNSGSMSGTRMTNLKQAANDATDILFDNQDTQPNVYISIIPFTQYVNVGTANRTASWMSQTGASSISHLNFDDDDDEDTPFTATVDRWALYDGFNNKPWTGCVEARITPYDTDDTVPNPAVPDTMFQPVFAPDSSINNYLTDDPYICYNRGSCNWVQTRTGCNNGGSNCTGPTTTAAMYTDKDGAVSGSTVYTYPETADVCKCDVIPADSNRITNATNNTTQTGTGSNRTRVQTRNCAYRYDAGASYANLSVKELQERLCKYKGTTPSGTGPNSDCPATSILPLNNVRATVKSRINAMVASGTTNIEQGTVWGFHSLSPTEPLTEGRSYEEPTSKVMIIMTDGENVVNYAAYSSSNPYGSSSWNAWGFRSNKRLLTESTTPKDSVATSAQFHGEVNRRTELACSNAKARGILVYSIGLSVPNNTTRTMLQNCATPTTTANGVTTVYSYFPTTPSELITVFTDIAAQLAELRLAQ